jgi:hypothetical protein
MKIQIFLIFSLVSFMTFAQPKQRDSNFQTQNSPVTIGPVTTPEEPVPLSGIELLIGGGLMAGLYRHFRGHRKK